MANLVGKTLLNRYNVQEFIGRGGMAEIYKVWDSHRMTYLAMKVLFEDLAIDRVFMRRFKREADTLAKLQHPNIVRFYGLEQDGPNAFILMDFIEGRNLKRAIFDAGGPMPQQEIRFIMRSVCGALQFAHSEGLAHCDIKPANIMIHENNFVLLSDFGIARMSDAATATMVGAGTPAYMAPEQVKGQDPTPQSDIYSLGVVLYEMLTGGERPFTGESATITGSTSEKLRWEQINAEPMPPSQWNKNITPALEAVILKCLQKDPQERYQTALDFFNALEIAFGEEEEKIKPLPAPLPSPSPTQRLRKPAASGQAQGQPSQLQLFLQQTFSREPNKNWLPAAGIAVAVIFILSMACFGLALSVGWLINGNAAKPAYAETPVLLQTTAPTFAPTKTKKTTATPYLSPTPELTKTSTPTEEQTNTPKPTDTPRITVSSVSAFPRPDKDGGATVITITTDAELSVVKFSDGSEMTCYEYRECSFEWALTQSDNSPYFKPGVVIHPYTFSNAGTFHIWLKVCAESKCDTDFATVNISR